MARRGKSAAPEGVHRNMRERIVRGWREIGPGRAAATVIFLILALLIARFSWTVAFADEIERVLYDVRATYAMERVEEDDRIVLIVYDEDTLFDTAVRSPLDRAILARALTNIEAMEPRAIAIDILFDQPTPNDAALISALRAMRTPTHLAVINAANNPSEIQPRQAEFLAGFHNAVRTRFVQPTSVYFQPDEDNVMRSWPPQPRDLPPLMANSLVPGNEAYRDHRGSIAYRLPAFADGNVFDMFTIDLLADPAIASEFADYVRGRYVLIGTELQDRDRFETPFTRIIGAEPLAAERAEGNATDEEPEESTISGLKVHAHLLAQMLDGVQFSPIPAWALWTVALIAVAAGGLTNLSDLRLWVLIPVIGGQIALFALLPFTLQRNHIETLALPVFGLAVGWAIAYAAVGTASRSVGSEKRRFVQGALARYLPPDIAQAIVDEPDRLSLTGEKCAIHAIFTDLQGFTALSHAIEPEMVAKLLNAYLDRLSDVVLDHGGTLDKFIGDAIVAFWGAPIARPDDADRAARCAVALWEAGEAIRAETPEGAPRLGVTRVGLHRGEAIVGNFGGEDRIQYTALGDAMNTASRLEGANKQTASIILVSGEAIEGVESVAFRPLGRITVSGRSTPVEIFEPVSPVTAATSESVRSCWRRFEAGDPQAVRDLETLASRHCDDAALGKMVYRLRNMKPGGSYVLEGK